MAETLVRPDEVKLVGVAGTYYPNHDGENQPRFETAVKMARTWSERGDTLVMVDSTQGDNNEVARRLEAAGAHVLKAKEGGLYPQQQQGFEEAFDNLDATHAMHVEPEKPDLIRHKAEIMGAATRHNVTLVGYNEVGRLTLPPTQRKLEEVGGHTYVRELGMPIEDNWRGPRIYDQAGAEVFMDYDPDQFPGKPWAHLWAVPLDAGRRGLSVGGVEVSSIHPKVVTEQETDNDTFDRKREMQYRIQTDPEFLQQLKRVGGLATEAA